MPHQDIPEIVHAIAEETHAPEETVARIYTQAIDDYRANARILDYVPLLAAKKVRATLREKNPARNK